jgi:hypothetical protein
LGTAHTTALVTAAVIATCSPADSSVTTDVTNAVRIGVTNATIALAAAFTCASIRSFIVFSCVNEMIRQPADSAVQQLHPLLEVQEAMLHAVVPVLVIVQSLAHGLDFRYPYPMLARVLSLRIRDLPTRHHADDDVADGNHQYTIERPLRDPHLLVGHSQDDHGCDQHG